MDRLVALLNEYEKDGLNEFETYVERWYCERTEQILSGKWENNNELKPCEIISKKYGFIQWLVDNDKIEPLGKYIGWETDEDELYIKFDLVDQYIAYLSIQDSPIDFLCSVLK